MERLPISRRCLPIWSLFRSFSSKKQFLSMKKPLLKPPSAPNKPEPSRFFFICFKISCFRSSVLVCLIKIFFMGFNLRYENDLLLYSSLTLHHTFASHQNYSEVVDSKTISLFFQHKINICCIKKNKCHAFNGIRLPCLFIHVPFMMVTHQKKVLFNENIIS